MSSHDSVLDISASDEDFDDGGIADTDINGQIKHMVAQNPQCAYTKLYLVIFIT
jgi:hypothetical protein